MLDQHVEQKVGILFRAGRMAIGLAAHYTIPTPRLFKHPR
jgi:hypothetical protein